MCGRTRSRTSVSWPQAGVPYAVKIPLMNWLDRNGFSPFCGCIAPPFNELPEKGRAKFTLFFLVWVLGCMIVTGKVLHGPKTLKTLLLYEGLGMDENGWVRMGEGVWFMLIMKVTIAKMDSTYSNGWLWN